MQAPGSVEQQVAAKSLSSFPETVTQQQHDALLHAKFSSKTYECNVVMGSPMGQGKTQESTCLMAELKWQNAPKCPGTSPKEKVLPEGMGAEPQDHINTGVRAHPWAIPIHFLSASFQRFCAFFSVP